MSEKLKLSYRITQRISKPMDISLMTIAQESGFEFEPYATGFNFQTGERDLVFERPRTND